MPDLDQYRTLAPFSARELVDAANSLLRSKPELELSERTLRYYVSENLLPSPEGPTKFARYSFDHLVGLTAIRFLQDHGISLARIRDELRSLFQPDNADARRTITGRLSAWLSTQERVSSCELAEQLSAMPRAPLAEETRGYARARSPSPRQDVAETVETLSMQVADMSRELSTGLHRVAEDRSQRSMDMEIHRLHSTIGELMEAVRELRHEIRALRGQAEPRPAKPESTG